MHRPKGRKRRKTGRRSHPAAKFAGNSGRRNYSYRACLDEGYDLAETHVQPIYYQIPPRGEHLSHIVTITMTKDEGQTTRYVIIEVQIITQEDGQLTCRDMSIKRQTVK